MANLIAQRGNRCSAAVLGYLEDHVYRQYPQISTEAQKRIRLEVLDQINLFKDLVLDIVKSDTDLINDFWVQKLDQIHEEIRALREAPVA